MSALDVNGMEGSTNSMSYMLGLLLIALNCLLFEIASLAAHAELLVWSCPILMANISKHKCFQGRKQSVKLGGMWLPSFLSPRLFTSGPEHVKVVMVSER